MEIRSFLAFELPADIKKVVLTVYSAEMNLPLDLKWIKPDNVHLTVVFMGNIPEDKIEAVGDAARKVCTGFAPFDVNPGPMGFFGSRRHPRVLWLGLNGEVRGMGYFRDALQKNLKPFGIKVERRPYKPHLTLGRFRKGAHPWPYLDHMMAKYRDIECPTSTMKELVLFKSDLRPGGAVYTKLDAWPLKGVGK